MQKENPMGVIFNIQRCSVHDGPGIRTVIFMKGCPLRCLWCHNPESHRKESRLLFDESLCVVCGKCVEACTEQVHSIIDGKRQIKQSLCKKSGKCIEACMTNALRWDGRTVSVNEIMTEVLKDEEYYHNSGGGLTLSGGEPLVQPEFVKALLIEAKKHGINTAIETSGYTSWSVLEGVLGLIDWIIYDIKLIDPEMHQINCNVDNKCILENLKRLTCQKTLSIFIRIPLIPNISDTVTNINAVASFLNSIGINKVELIPYHTFASDKYKALGQTIPIGVHKTQDPATLNSIQNIFTHYGLESTIGI